MVATNNVNRNLQLSLKAPSGAQACCNPRAITKEAHAMTAGSKHFTWVRGRISPAHAPQLILG